MITVPALSALFVIGRAVARVGKELDARSINYRTLMASALEVIALGVTLVQFM